jgi:predicted ATPase
VTYDPAGARYRMLEPVRQYAHERLVEAGEAEAIRVAHRDWAMRLAAEGNRGLFVDQARWTSTLDVESANHAAAIGGALAADELDAASSLVSALAWYWFTAQRGEGMVWISRVLDRIEELDARGQARTRLAGGIILCDVLDDDRPPAWLAAAEEGFRAAGNRRALGAALFWQGRALALRGREPEARRCFEEGAPLHEELGDPFGQGWCLTWLATLARLIDGDLERADAMLAEVTALAERTGVTHVIAAAMAERSELKAWAGDADAAIELCTQCVELFREVGDRWQLGMALHRRAGLRLHARQDVPGAAGDLLEALDLAESLRAWLDVATVVVTSADALRRVEQPELAAELLGATLARLDVTEERRWYDRSGGVGALRSLVDDPAQRASVERGQAMDLRTAAGLARKALQALV